MIYAANKEMLRMYWDIGEMLQQSQDTDGWGEDSSITKSVISQLDKYNFTLPVKHLHWTHNLVLMKQVKDIRTRYWYMVQSITNYWTTRYLQEAIKLDDYDKHGALANNFIKTLPVPEANDVKSMLKTPYKSY